HTLGNRIRARVFGERSKTDHRPYQLNPRMYNPTDTTMTLQQEIANASEARDRLKAALLRRLSDMEREPNAVNWQRVCATLDAYRDAVWLVSRLAAASRHADDIRSGSGTF